MKLVVGEDFSLGMEALFCPLIILSFESCGSEGDSCSHY